MGVRSPQNTYEHGPVCCDGVVLSWAEAHYGWVQIFQRRQFSFPHSGLVVV